MKAISISGAELYYDGHFLPAEEATQLFKNLVPGSFNDALIL